MIKGFLISWQNNENIYESNFKEILTSIKYLEVHMHVHEYSDMQSLTVYPEVSFLKAKKYIDLKSFRGQKMTPPPIIEISQQDVESPPQTVCFWAGLMSGRTEAVHSQLYARYTGLVKNYNLVALASGPALHLAYILNMTWCTFFLE